MTYTIILLNSSGGELDRKTGDDMDSILRQYAEDGCLAGGDALHIIDNGGDSDDQGDDGPFTMKVCDADDPLDDFNYVGSRHHY